MQRPGLLTLPAELRNQIWEDVVVEPDIHNRKHHRECPLIDHSAAFAQLPFYVQELKRYPWESIEEASKRKKCRKQCRARQCLGLLRVNKQIASEATPIFWENASFYFASFPELSFALTYRIPEIQHPLIKGIAVHDSKQWRPWWRWRYYTTDSEAKCELARALQCLPNLKNLQLCTESFLKLNERYSRTFLDLHQPEIADVLMHTGRVTLLKLLEVPLLGRSAENPYACVSRTHTSTFHKSWPGESDTAWRKRLESAVCRDARDMDKLAKQSGPVRKVFLKHLKEAVQTDTVHKEIGCWTNLGKSYAEHVSFLGILPKRQEDTATAQQQEPVIFKTSAHLTDPEIHILGPATAKQTKIISKPNVRLTDPEDHINQEIAKQTRIQSQATRFNKDLIDHEAVLEQRRIKNIIAAKSEEKSRKKAVKKAVKKSLREQNVEKKACRKRSGRRS
ncbi:hypothetical protein CKM354_000692800 [Cercospora kikuchii]|uniref:DUF7730 domain-containing protein n=1 Tax=Cercospora kikuchii TaxID=84275 RepID=A0A9P3FDT3_9PEZI|nr:uncharacterized protein CKM354_000692800 [Cercospora kikuchii]GIZ43711.1 hypothetical protein CKM354_000692800 [Cercospora kikuchii]